jgi:CDP-diacylglycerol--glycerol-3-phosphate 3-phosphatidyltransferase
VRFNELTLPNKLSLSRILAVPLIVFFLSSDIRWFSVVACLLFLAASITDGIDGYLARRNNDISKMGKLLDPLADKILIFATLIMLMHLDRVHFLYVIVLIGRDISVNSLRGFATQQGIVMEAHILGKHKTALQIVALVGLTLGPENPVIGVDLFVIGQVFLILATVAAIVSAGHYFNVYGKRVTKN